ncbi:serine hydrolase [Rhodanobacter soli]|uniref:CubicO group peptidase (Beta-lactamase class C family) n=1 Tax=Rhodanobacter soli TaxID=590609 RepID=A0ABV2PYA0_9GAMM
MTCKFARLSLRRLLVPFMAGALAVIAAPAWAAAPQDLDAFAARAMKAFDTPGMAVAIVEDGQAATHVYGIRKLGAPERVDAHTVFPIGSNTKAFTAAALAILVDQGKLHWDDLVVDKLPGFRMYDAYTSQHMTITDLLVHRSGLGLGQGDLMFLPSTTRSRAELVHAIRHLKPATGFRSGFAYDNVLYSVAGELVEAVSGERWEDFVQRHMLSPMGMRDTLTSLDVQGPDSVSLHGKISGPVRGMGPPSVLGTVLSGDVCAPAGALRVSADDMTHWLRVQLAHGALDGDKRLFSEAASQALWTPQTLVPIDAPPAPLALTRPAYQAYALGLFVRDYRGHRIVMHTGGVLGAYSVVAILPERHVAFAIMLNAEDAGTLMATFYHLLDHYLGLPPTDWIGNYRQVDELGIAAALKAIQARQAKTHPERGPSLPPAGYAGVFSDPWYGTATISRGKDGMRLSMDRTPGMQGALEHVQYDTFRTHWSKPGLEDAYVTFALRPDGSVDHMTMQAISPLADFSYDYQDLYFTPVAEKR